MKTSLKNKLLLASPHMEDPFFQHSVIYIARHTPQGAYGLIINRPAPMDIKELFDDLNVVHDDMQSHDVLIGGPVRPEAGFILHTGQPHWQASEAIGENICLTTSKDILQAIALNQLKHYHMTLGYCNWRKNQLEQELSQGDWQVCPVDMDLLFNLPYEQRWQAAYDKINIDPIWLVEEIGRA